MPPNKNVIIFVLCVVLMTPAMAMTRKNADASIQIYSRTSDMGITISQNGNVAINTTNTTEALTISGNGVFSGGVSAGTITASALVVNGGVAYGVAALSGTQTLTSTQNVVLLDASSQICALTLPAVASVLGRQYTILKSDASGNTVTISGYGGGETINGKVTYVLATQYEFVKIIAASSGWFVIGR